MKRHLLFILTVAVLAMAGAAGVDAQGTSRPRIDPKLTAKLREDLTTAMANANLSEQQQRTLDEARETLKAAAEARAAGESVDRDKVRKALSDIRGVVDSDALRPEDAKRVKEDLEAIQKAARDQMKRRGPRRRPLDILKDQNPCI